jgi:hypothetical protein
MYAQDIQHPNFGQVSYVDCGDIIVYAASSQFICIQPKDTTPSLPVRTLNLYGVCTQLRLRREHLSGS